MRGVQQMNRAPRLFNVVLVRGGADELIPSPPPGTVSGQVQRLLPWRLLRHALTQ
jgi:hypothetical protein